MFTNKEEILKLIEEANKNSFNKEIFSKFKKLNIERTEFYINLQELEEILKWKLRNQYGRQKTKRKINTDENIKLITKTAFSIKHNDKEYETKLKLKTLSLIYGVEIPVASAILTICFPTKYSIIDFRNWRQVYKTEIKKTTYSTSEYLDYMKEIKVLAKKYEMTTQEIDVAIWQKDINENG